MSYPPIKTKYDSSSILQQQWRQNHFDLIRLIAALQVVYVHSVGHLLPGRLETSLFAKFLSYFPGVPIFFFLSGYLVYASFERHYKEPWTYYRNRFLRIFPGLWFCVFLTAALLFALGYLQKLSPLSLFSYFAAQLSIGQVYTPHALRGFGLGHPNGSLWTIAVELQFYFCVPIIAFILRRVRIPRKNNLKVSKQGQAQILLVNTVLGGFILASLAINAWLDKRIHSNDLASSADFAYKLLKASALPYLWLFVLGIFFRLNRDTLQRFIDGRALYWILGYALYAGVGSIVLDLYQPTYWPNLFGVLGWLILCFVIVSFGRSKNTLLVALSKPLKGNDFSYGVYLYHMVVVNTVLELGYATKLNSVLLIFLVVVVVLFLGWLSWTLVEKRALAYK